MNQNILWGTVAFSIWATFSTWYYVNYIKDLGNSTPVELPHAVDIETPKPVEPIVDQGEIEEVRDERVEEPTLPPVNISKTFLFDLNSDELSPEVEKAFGEIKNLGRLDLEMTVEGYACDLGSEEYNRNLSERRAEKVSEYFRQNMPEMKNVIVKFYGESSPAFANISEANRMKNRRVTVTLQNQP